ncbi:hypothetical protein LPW11_00755 [Geomonas sp. RF6]|uniref:fibronectin type III domain-containing protein n=1 Tax=Geomonas sp. RF6 TaxID=2897342 RepID=UPI001E2E3DA7|nr:hypothetical protein [Geomonas sp. RF6]UFS70734.1 hypothetical protein LPW11_00755 [Geomonas sp. RF6]
MLRLLFVICFLLIGPCGNAWSLDAIRPKLACFPLAPASIDAMAYNEKISSLLVNALDRTGAVEVVERKKIEGVIEQHGLRLDTLDLTRVREVGETAGFDFILAGTVGRKEGRLSLELTLMGTHTQTLKQKMVYEMADGEILSKLEEIAAATVPKMRDAQKLTATVLPAAPSAELVPPGDLQATGSSRSIRVRWNHPAASAVSGYKVFRSTSENGTYSLLSRSSRLSYNDEGLELNDRFYYKVSALGREGGESPLSSAVQGATLVVPAAPIFMQISPGILSADLSWYPRPASGKDPMVAPVAYRVYRAEGETADFQRVAELQSGTTAYKDPSLREGTRYRYYLTAVNGSGGESDESTVLEVTTVGGMGELTASSNLIRKVSLSWKEHPHAGIEGYAVYRSAQKEGPFDRVGRTATRGGTSYLDTLDCDNCVRWYRIAAVGKDGSETPQGPAVSATTRPPPPAPLAPVARSGEPRRVTVAWQPAASAEDESGGYSVYRSERGEGDFTRIARVPERVYLYEDASPPLKDNTPYWYRVAALNGAGVEGAPSPPVQGVTKQKPATPRGVSARTGEVRKVSIYWQPNPEPDLKEYLVWRKEKGESYTLLGSTRIPGFVDAELGDGVQHTYSVSAVDSDGVESFASPAIEAKTAPAPSRASGARVVRRGEMAGIVWEKNPESNIRAYNVYRKVFLGRQKVTETTATEYLFSGKEKVELFVTAVNADGLEGEPSEPVVLEYQ